MSSPALYWDHRTVALSTNDCLNSAKGVMKSRGLTKITMTSKDVSGRTATVHASIGPVKKKDPPSPGPGLGTTAPPTQILFFVAAGDDAKDVLVGLLKAWDALKFQ